MKQRADFAKARTALCFFAKAGKKASSETPEYRIAITVNITPNYQVKSVKNKQKNARESGFLAIISM